MSNALGPVMLAGLGIFIAWLAIVGRASAVASAITGAQSTQQQGGGATGTALSFSPPSPAALIEASDWTTTQNFDGSATSAPTSGGNFV